jgi:hypothetical protein
MNSATHHGVQISVQGSKIVVDDGTQSSAVASVQIEFQDLVGQPIWTGVNTIRFKTVMRGDIPLLTRVTMPNAPTSLTQAGAAAGNQNPNTNAPIQGTFTVNQERHTANFRQPDWASWCTTFDAVTPLPSSPRRAPRSFRGLSAPGYCGQNVQAFTQRYPFPRVQRWGSYRTRTPRCASLASERERDARCDAEGRATPSHLKFSATAIGRSGSAGRANRIPTCNSELSIPAPG